MPAPKTRSKLDPSPFIAIIAGLGMALSYGLTPAPDPADDVGILQENGCTSFAESSRVPGTPVWWTYRVCPEPSADYRLDLRFANASDQAIGFRYQTWIRNPGRCGGSLPEALDEGTRTLGGGETEETPSSIRIPRAGFEGRVWLCASEVVGLTAAQRLLYSVPCGPLGALPACRRVE